MVYTKINSAWYGMNVKITKGLEKLWDFLNFSIYKHTNVQSILQLTSKLHSLWDR